MGGGKTAYSKKIILKVSLRLTFPPWHKTFGKLLLASILPSLFHKKITVTVTKSLHQDCGPCYLHLPIFLLYMHSALLLANKKLFSSVFLSKLDRRSLFNYIYIMRLSFCAD